MSRLDDLFKTKTSNIINIYCTAGFPQLESTLAIMKSLESNGADIIELGIPYSDPVADGPAIQHSDDVALQNGMTIQKLFDQLKDLRPQISIPVILMGYLNPVMQFGFEKFCQKASETGVDGFIIPDLPAYEFENYYSRFIREYNLSFSFLITPETSEDRVRKLDALSSGFLYAVTSSSTTGGEKDFEVVNRYLQRLRSYELKNPLLAGFGVNNKDAFQKVCRYAHGAIIGSAYIKALQLPGSIEENTKKFLENIIK